MPISPLRERGRDSGPARPSLGSLLSGYSLSAAMDADEAVDTDLDFEQLLSERLLAEWQMAARSVEQSLRNGSCSRPGSAGDQSSEPSLTRRARLAVT